MRHHTPLLLCGLLAACATGRTSTPEERAFALATLSTIETTVVVLKAANKITVAQYELATRQITQLRIEVADSAETPVAWTDIYQRVLNLAAAWLTPQPQPAR